MDILPVIVMLDDTFACYNQVSNKANGARSEPPHAALSSHDGGNPS